MLETVLATIDKFNMINKGESLLCCLSGGADSVALLLCLHQKYGNLKACHVNHGLRGDESDRDEEFCVNLCRSLDIPIEVRHIDAAGFSKQNGCSIEEGARILRYRVFEEMGCDKIATAHTLSDCIETTIFNLIRGSSVTGLASIPPVRGRIIRPLIECSREQVEEFLLARGQGWVTDSTNLIDEYTRNKIRHNIVPILKEINPSLNKTFSSTLDNLREDSACLKGLGDELFESSKKGKGLDTEKLLKADKAVSDRAIMRLLEESSIQYSRQTIERVRNICVNGGKLTVGKELYAVAHSGVLYIEDASIKPEEIEIKASIGEEYIFGNKRVTLILTDFLQKLAIVKSNVTNFYADYDKIKGEILVRHRHSGDRIRLIGRGFTSDVKKLVQSGFSPDERKNALVLSDDNGVIYVEGYGFAERVKAQKDTKTFLFCKIS